MAVYSTNRLQLHSNTGKICTDTTSIQIHDQSLLLSKSFSPFVAGKPRHCVWITAVCTPHIWCLSQARIKWDGYGRKGIWHKNGGCWRGSLISLDGVALSRMVGVSASVILPCTIKVQKNIFFWHQLTWVVPEKRAIKWLCVCVCCFRLGLVPLKRTSEDNCSSFFTGQIPSCRPTNRLKNWREQIQRQSSFNSDFCWMFHASAANIWRWKYCSLV